ncbi:conserved protein of unknown function [Methanocaldococcus lauensis]|uniref:Uncharacterized protein n=1 Tax=Methanocaldococcus lauensis TaxID=2546128 RepID=A0A8D6PP49_9EURY|nr:hypothetical protein [Methanocaldococcus lauensis]CAB3287303.1 conserved protein of unknown function [Methanocaldococcus lauensis]
MDDIIKILKEFGIFSEYLKILDIEVEGDKYITILIPDALDWIELEEIEEILEKKMDNVRIKISKLPLSRFIKIYLERNLKNKTYGNFIENIEIDGINYALYIDWKNKKIIIHKFNGKNPITESCKLSSSWETPWGLWVLGFKSREEAKKFAENLASEIYKYYKIKFESVEHKRCLMEN